MHYTEQIYKGCLAQGAYYIQSEGEAVVIDSLREVKPYLDRATSGLSEPPAYFPHNVKMNKSGYESIDQVVDRRFRPLSPEEFETMANERGVLVLDVRCPSEFAEAHIPHSIFIELHGNFASWVGELVIDTQTPLLFVAPEGREKAVVMRLSRVGFDHTRGYLKGGVVAWRKAGKQMEKINSITADDVRTPDEYATNCAGGYQSMIAASMLEAKGLSHLVNVEGEYNAICDTSIPLAHNMDTLAS